MTVYPKLSRTICPAVEYPPRFQDTDALGAWLSSSPGIDWVKHELENHWDCFNALDAVHKQELTWADAIAKPK